MKQLTILLCSVLIAGSAFAKDIKTYRVHYSIRGSGHDVIVQADTSYDARYTVEHMFPGALVTNTLWADRTSDCHCILLVNEDTDRSHT